MKPDIEYIGDGHVRLEPGTFKLYVGRGWDSEFAKGRIPESPAAHFAWMMIAPSGHFSAWPKSRVRRWWLKRRGCVFYDGDGNRA